MFSEKRKMRLLQKLLCGGTVAHRSKNKRSALFFYGGCITIIIGILICGGTKKKVEV